MRLLFLSFAFAGVFWLVFADGAGACPWLLKGPRGGFVGQVGPNGYGGYGGYSGPNLQFQFGYGPGPRYYDPYSFPAYGGYGYARPFSSGCNGGGPPQLYGGYPGNGYGAPQFYGGYPGNGYGAPQGFGGYGGYGPPQVYGGYGGFNGGFR